MEPNNFQPRSNGLQPKNDGLRPNNDGLQPDIIQFVTNPWERMLYPSPANLLPWYGKGYRVNVFVFSCCASRETDVFGCLGRALLVGWNAFSSNTSPLREQLSLTIHCHVTCEAEDSTQAYEAVPGR